MRNAIYISLVVVFILAGCSSSNPITSPQDETLPASGITAANTLGAYELTIDSDSMTAELIPKRESAIGESWIISGKSYFDMSPCKDCFKISGLGLEDDRLVIKFSIRHPFQKGNSTYPPSGKNRLDLDIFDLAMVVYPKSFNTLNFPLTNISIPSYTFDDPQGYTNELSSVISRDLPLPYLLIIDDSASDPPANTYNKFEMGANKSFELKIKATPGQSISLNLYLTFGYGSSAVLANRFNPKYFNPEFNRKAAWKVDITPPNGNNPPEMGNTWCDSDSTTLYDILVEVYDWQIGATVNPTLENSTDIYASSNVSKVTLEIPGMHSAIKELTTSSSGTGMPDSPLSYTFSLANENLLPSGDYSGLIAVYDERSPLEPSAMRDYLIHSPDGGKNLIDHLIPSYVTYQTFKASVVEFTIDESLNLMWAKRAGGSQFDYSYSLAILSEDSIIVVGDYFSNCTFGPGEPNQTILSSAGFGDIYIARYNPDGTLVWVKRAGGSGSDAIYSIVPLPDDSLIVTGIFMFTATFGPGEPSETQLVASGAYDIFIAKYNSSGELQWAKRAGGTDYESSKSITKLSDNSTVICGYFQGTATFGSGEPNETTLTATGTEEEIFVAGYNTDGTLRWAKRAGGIDEDEPNGISAMTGDSVVVTGSFMESATFGQGEPNQTTLTAYAEADMFIACYNTDGSLEWVKKAGGNEDDYGITVFSSLDNSVFVAGLFSESATFGEGETYETVIVSPSYENMFIAKYNPNGTFQWVKHAESEMSVIPNAMKVLSDNTTLITGSFGEGVTFNPGGVGQTYFASNGGQDVFIVKFDASGSFISGKTAGTNGDDYGTGIATLTDGSVAVTGYFSESIVFGAGETNETQLTSAGYEDIFVARFEY